MSNFELSDADKEKLKRMNLFEGYQCERDPALWKVHYTGCKNTMGIIMDNCLECPNWKSFRELDYDDED